MKPPPPPGFETATNRSATSPKVWVCVLSPSGVVEVELRDEFWPAGEGLKMRVRRGGSGGPCVIFDAGWGQWSAAWAIIQAAVAQHARTFSFDRLGLGKSDRPKEERSAFQLADELQQALREAQEPGPYLYVGHGFGAVHARMLAHRDPQVRAMVLVDPVVLALGVSKPFEEHRNLGLGRLRHWRWLAAAHLLTPVNFLLRRPAEARRLPKPAAKELRYGHSSSVLDAQVSELLALEMSMEQLRVVGAPNVPLVVLSASEDWLPGPSVPGATETRVQSMHRKLAESTPLGAHRVVPKTSHHLHLDAPDSVIQTVLEVLPRI